MSEDRVLDHCPLVCARSKLQMSGAGTVKTKIVQGPKLLEPKDSFVNASAILHRAGLSLSDESSRFLLFG